jgi:hypothetical protein
MPADYVSEGYQQVVNSVLQALPDPSYVRINCAAKTIPYDQGEYEFTSLGDFAVCRVEYLDAEMGLMAWQDYGSIQKGEHLVLHIPEGRAWYVKFVNP